jgi:hypothetical protein
LLYWFLFMWDWWYWDILGVYVTRWGSMSLYRCREGTPILSLYCLKAGLMGYRWLIFLPF